MDTYRIAPGGFTPEGWVVVPEATSETPNPPAVIGFDTKQEAQAEADRLNALALAEQASETAKSSARQQARAHVMAAYQGSHESFASLYKKLAE